MCILKSSIYNKERKKVAKAQEEQEMKEAHLNKLIVNLFYSIIISLSPILFIDLC